MNNLRKVSAVLVVILLLLSACSIKTEPFEKGTIKSGAYVNLQSNLKFTPPEGWEMSIGEDAQMDVLEANNILNEEKFEEGDTATFDLEATETLTGSNLNLSYSPISKYSSYEIEKNAAFDLLEKEAESLDWNIEKMGEYEYRIADQMFSVLEIAIEMDGLVLSQYLCFREMDGHACVIIITPSPFGGDYTTLQSIADCFEPADD